MAVVAGLLALVAVLSQVLLPGLAASRVRARVQRYGSVRTVHVSAFPAVELLWGSADSVSVDAGTITITPAQAVSLLSEAHTIGTLTVTAGAAMLRVSMLAQGLTVGGVRLEKHGDTLLATAHVTQAQLDAALPSGVRVEPTRSAAGTVEARASGGLFGVPTTLTALVRPNTQGALIAEPLGLPFGGLARVTLFSDSHLKVRTVSARLVSHEPVAYALSLRASLND